MRQYASGGNNNFKHKVHDQNHKVTEGAALDVKYQISILHGSKVIIPQQTNI